MDNTNYFKAKSLIDKIDRLSNSVDETIRMIENFKKDPETAKLYVRANGDDCTITLTKELSEKFLTDIVYSYVSLIMEAQKDMNEIINNTIHEKN